MILAGLKKTVMPCMLAASLAALCGCAPDVQPTESFAQQKLSVVELGGVILQWSRPQFRTDGTALAPQEIKGYRIYYGQQSGNYPNRIEVSQGALETFEMPVLPTGTYFVVVTTLDADGRESDYSPELMLLI